MNFRFFCVVLIGILGVVSCKNGHENAPDGVPSFCLSDSMAKLITLDTVRIEPVRRAIRLSGKVTFDVENSAEIYPVVGGAVEEVFAELGDYVKKGQPLAKLKSAEISVYEQQLTNADATLVVAKRNLEIKTEMFKGGLIAEKDLLDAKQAVLLAEAEVKKLQDIFKINNFNKNADYTINSPVSGFVVAKRVTPGMQLRSDKSEAVFVISALNEAWIMAEVYETDIAKIKEGLTAEIRLITYPDSVFYGKIDKIFNVLDPQTHVMKVRIRLPNPRFILKPDMFASVVIYHNEQTPMRTLYAQSVIFDKNQYFVMTYKGNCNISTRPIQLYFADDKRAYIRGGIEPGEQVIKRHNLLIYDQLND